MVIVFFQLMHIYVKKNMSERSTINPTHITGQKKKTSVKHVTND